jgi:hypothetical protein
MYVHINRLASNDQTAGLKQMQFLPFRPIAGKRCHQL